MHDRDQNNNVTNYDNHNYYNNFTITINFFTDDDCKGKLLDSTTLYT